MYSTKLVLSVLTIACMINTSLARKCYYGTWHNYDKKYSGNSGAIELLCAADAPLCGKFTVDIEKYGKQFHILSKGCAREKTAGEDCKAYFIDVIEESGQFTPQDIQKLKILISDSDVRMGCSFCDGDFCNSSSVAYPSIIVLILLCIFRLF